jgi:predicted Zn-dependent protease
MRKHRFWLLVSVTALLVFCLSDCATIENQIESITGVEVSEGQKDAIVKTTKALRDSFSDITEEEEYYIGRAVSAQILGRYPAYKNQALNTYVNQVGYAVAVHSERPEIYAGYHFQVLDTDEVNALAAPGGFIFITKGLLKRCRDEEMLGCILAHEVGHVSARHGLRSIKKSRLVDAFKVMGQEATRAYGPQELAKLTSIFEDALGDIAEKLIESGYDRKYEYEADKLGAAVGAKTGYSPQGLVDFLQTMVDQPGTPDKGWFKTHPSAKDRINRAQKEIGKLKTKPAKQDVRTSRFQQAVQGLK